MHKSVKKHIFLSILAKFFFRIVPLKRIFNYSTPPGNWRKDSIKASIRTRKILSGVPPTKS